MLILLINTILLSFSSFAMELHREEYEQSPVEESDTFFPILRELRKQVESMEHLKELKRGALLSFDDGKPKPAINSVNDFSKLFQSATRTLKNNIFGSNDSRANSIRFGTNAANITAELIGLLSDRIHNSFPEKTLLKYNKKTLNRWFLNLPKDFRNIAIGWSTLKGSYIDIDSRDITTIRDLQDIENLFYQCADRLEALFKILVERMTEETLSVDLFQKLDQNFNPIEPLDVKAFLGSERERTKVKILLKSGENIDLEVLADTVKRLNSCTYFWNHQMIKNASAFEESQAGKDSNILEISNFHELLREKLAHSEFNSFNSHILARLTEVTLSFASIVSSSVPLTTIGQMLSESNWLVTVSNKQAFFNFNLDTEAGKLIITNTYPAEYKNIEHSGIDLSSLFPFFLIHQTFEIDLHKLSQFNELTKEELVEQCVISKYALSDRYISEEMAIKGTFNFKE